MPNVTIEVRRQYTSAEEEAIIAAVHAALMEGIRTPEWDRTMLGELDTLTLMDMAKD